MSTSFHSKIAQHIVELELERISKRNPSLGVRPDTQERVTWEMLMSSSAPEPSAPEEAGLRSGAPLFPDDLPSVIPSDSEPTAPPTTGITDPVAIIGAGPAGLRIAMMLKHLKIPYVVLEASERYGGRVYTYHFKKVEGEAATTQNYFDVGAMRFPDNAANERTFELFKELGITSEGGTGGKLLRYHLSTEDNILLFNGEKY